MVIDTNILIAYIGGDGLVIDILDHWKKNGRSLFISSVTETEILSYSKFTKDEEKAIEKFLEENFVLIEFGRKVARIAAHIRQRSKIKFPDAAIAATALFLDRPLVTRDKKDFGKVTSVQVITI